MRLFIGLSIVALLACGETSNATPSPSPGNPAVYARIAAETDCAELQVEFDNASAAHDRAESGSPARAYTLAYMAAAEARKKALDC